MKESWIDLLDKDKIPYIDQEDYEVRYPTNSIYMMDTNEYEDLKNISSTVFNALCSLVEDIRSYPNAVPLDLLNMTPDLSQYIYNDNSPIVSYISRLDFVKDVNGQFKLVEINADTPCAIPETFYGNNVARKYLGYPEINIHTEWESLIRSIDKIVNNFPMNIVCAASKEYLEDWTNAKAVRYLLSATGIKPYKDYLVDLSELIVKDDGVYIKDGLREIKADILYLLHPKEMLVNDTSNTGYPVGKKLLELANDGEVVLINPPKAILLQNKALLAAIRYISKYRNILDYIALTHLSYGECLGKKCIKKPIFGREGINVEVIDAKGTTLYSAEDEIDINEFIFQDFIESEQVQVETDAGIWSGKYTYSLFIINGIPSQPFIRFSPFDICGLESLWVPVVVKG